MYLCKLGVIILISQKKKLSLPEIKWLVHGSTISKDPSQDSSYPNQGVGATQKSWTNSMIKLLTYFSKCVNWYIIVSEHLRISTINSHL